MARRFPSALFVVSWSRCAALLALAAGATQDGPLQAGASHRAVN